MKHIQKRKPPRELNQWEKANAKFADAKYGRYGFPTIAVQKSLLAEQGHLCAYTMIRVDESTSHNEHLKPQTVSRDEGKLEETAEYDNIVACYPRARVEGDPIVVFGAIYRGSNWDQEKFISPLKPICEHAFRYQIDGKIVAMPCTIGDPEWMIKILNLNASELEGLRRAAIESIGLSFASDNPATAREARDILASICKADKEGNFRPYCLAIKHAAEEYIQLIEKKTQKKRYIRKSLSQGRK